MSSKILLESLDYYIKRLIHNVEVKKVNRNKFNGNNKRIIALEIGDEKNILSISSTIECDFSVNERKIIDSLETILSGLKISTKNKALELSSTIALFDVLISYYLRDHKSNSYNFISNIISVLKSLSFEKYEGQSCSSGFFFFDNYSKGIADVLNNDEQYTYEEFKNGKDLDISFFDFPASFRYVDGKNSFYVTDDQDVKGIIRINNPQKYTFIERCNNKHITDVFDLCKNRFKEKKYWNAYIGRNQEVIVTTPHDVDIIWNKNFWNFRDKSILINVLKSHIDITFIDELINIINALSYQKIGTLILIADDNKKIPEAISHIDTTEFGRQILDTMKTENVDFKKLLLNNSITNILASDGLTVFSKRGQLLDCGNIVDLSILNVDSKIDYVSQFQKKDESKRKSRPPKNENSGGGRSQAARAASKYGLTIKVSEDGPISIFYKLEEIIKI